MRAKLSTCVERRKTHMTSWLNWDQPGPVQRSPVMHWCWRWHRAAGPRFLNKYSSMRQIKPNIQGAHCPNILTNNFSSSFWIIHRNFWESLRIKLQINSLMNHSEWFVNQFDSLKITDQEKKKHNTSKFNSTQQRYIITKKTILKKCF